MVTCHVNGAKCPLKKGGNNVTIIPDPKSSHDAAYIFGVRTVIDIVSPLECTRGFFRFDRMKKRLQISRQTLLGGELCNRLAAS